MNFGGDHLTGHMETHHLNIDLYLMVVVGRQSRLLATFSLEPQWMFSSVSSPLAEGPRSFLSNLDLVWQPPLRLTKR